MGLGRSEPGIGVGRIGRQAAVKSADRRDDAEAEPHPGDVRARVAPIESAAPPVFSRLRGSRARSATRSGAAVGRRLPGRATRPPPGGENLTAIVDEIADRLGQQDGVALYRDLDRQRALRSIPWL